MTVAQESQVNPLEASKEIRALAMKLTYHQIDKEERARTIHAYVANEIRYEPLYDVRRPYRTAQETLLAKAGCCAEKSYLAIALSRCSGLDAKYVSILLRPLSPGAREDGDADDTDNTDEDEPGDDDDRGPSGLEGVINQAPRGHAGVNIHVNDKIVFLETTDPKGYNHRPPDKELLSFKEITDAQAIADFNARNAPVVEQVVEPYTPRDIVVQASNELMVGVLKRAIMVCLGAGLTLLYSCATQPRTSTESSQPAYQIYAP